MSEWQTELQIVGNLTHDPSRDRSIFGAIKQAIFIFDLETQQILDANESCTHLYGYARDELLSMTMANLLPDDMANEDWMDFRHFLTVDESPVRGFAPRHQKKDGSIIWVDITCSIIDFNGKDTGMAVAIDITERVLLDRKLTERSKYLEALVHDAPDAIVTLDRSHLVKEWNPGATRLFGFTPEEARGKNIDDLIAKDNVTSEAQIFTRQVLEGGVVHPHASVRYRKDGTAIQVLVSGSPIVMDGELVGVIAVYKDITEQKNAEEALQRAKNDLESLFQSIDDSVVALDADHTIIRINDCFRRWIGATSEADVLGLKCYQLFHNRDKMCPDCPADLVIRTGNPVQIEKFSPAVDKYLHISVSPVIDISGRVTEVIEISRDITDRRRSEIALKESEAKYRMLADVASELGQCVVILQDRDGCIGTFQFVNDAVCKLTGYSREELAEMTADMLVDPEQMQIVMNNYSRRQRGENPPERYEIIIRNKQGQRVLVDATFQTLAYEGQIATIALFTDITQQRSLEEQLQQSQKLEALGLLASGVAHNINTPLSSIIGYAEMLKITGKSSEESEAIICQALRIKDIVNTMMLKTSRDQEVEPAVININDLLQTELRFFEANLHFKHDVIKKFDFSLNLPNIKGVYSDFSQSLMNIISNANDAMFNADEKNMTIRTDHRDGKVVIEVTDTGEGIPPENLPHLFEPFFTTKPRRGEQSPGVPVGTGLGLYSAHQLLSKYGAELRVESTIGVGSTFVVEIPCPG
jgi:PAS domain S-box-containing protein